ncbi:MAG: class I SAM-dependent methyltransferase [Thermoanaerobaculia bacterium]
MARMESPKRAVQDFWNRSTCGEVYAQGSNARERFDSHAQARYELEPFIPHHAGFEEAQGKDVLEVGVGMGADHVEWARQNPRLLVGVDLTPMAAAFTKARLWTYQLTGRPLVADAEHLPFPDESFDIAYSWGVVHHSPDTPAAINEIHRVLRHGSVARVMIYSKYSIVGALLWIRYAALRGRPFTPLHAIYSEFLESPGTKAYSVREARQLFSKFSDVRIHKELSPGDLMIGEAGQRHQGTALALARRVWPRRMIRLLFRRLGLFLIIEAKKK